MSSVVYLMIRDDFSVLSFGFADQNVILWSPVKFGGLRLWGYSMAMPLNFEYILTWWCVRVGTLPRQGKLCRRTDGMRHSGA
ncbi:unnamed protein product [Microthlaspi erraticum]|uniref:Uncharacterized protein n=1 Tax=Microthlaspi erraticum TaxID=1685480 RepID=A0A6D2JLI3_9BRAS|nr:unnamed protein product [Microthlaspi erraticum]